MTEQDYDPEYKKLPMWDQLGKILDSQENPFPRNWVETDDGDKIVGINPKDAMDIRKVLILIEKPSVRKELLNSIQTTQGLNTVLKYVRSAPNAFKNLN
jgi:hypothetical protein